MQKINIKEKDGSITEYIRDQNGVIKQLYPKRFKYDASYIAIYDQEKYTRMSDALQGIRFGYVASAFEDPIHSLVDCGYGNGAFLKYVVKTNAVTYPYGYDISGVPVPSGAYLIEGLPMTNEGEGCDIITFWDCLEHFPDLSFLANIKAKMIAISLPWCHFNHYASTNRLVADPFCKLAAGWFTSWHHRKPDEHLHHFDKNSLIATMAMYGWKVKHYTNIEDAVRKPKDNHYKNILTAIFTR